MLLWSLLLLPDQMLTAPILSRRVQVPRYRWGNRVREPARGLTVVPWPGGNWSLNLQMEPLARPSQVTALLAEGPVVSLISWRWYMIRSSSAAPALGSWGEGRVPENLSVKDGHIGCPNWAPWGPGQGHECK